MTDIEKLERIRALAHETEDLVIGFEGDAYNIANNLSGGFISLAVAMKLYGELGEDE